MPLKKAMTLFPDDVTAARKAAGISAPPVEAEKLLDNEKLYNWNELSDGLKELVIDVYAYHLKISKHGARRETLNKIFEMGSPKIIIGDRGPDQQPYLRVHADNVGIITLLMNNFLK